LTNAANLIDLTVSININKDHKTVFDYFSDYRNDIHWRKEITKVLVDTGRVDLGSLTTETSALSKKVPAYTAILKCIDFIPHKLITNETTAQSAFYSKNSRTVEATANNNTKLTYQLQFDKDIVKYGLGFQLPKILVCFYTRQTMKSYLAVLKKIVEQ
jgi:hypothetical protein